MDGPVHAIIQYSLCLSLHALHIVEHRHTKANSPFSVYYRCRCSTPKSQLIQLLCSSFFFLDKLLTCFSFDTCSQLQINARVPSERALTYMYCVYNCKTCLDNCKTCLEQSAVRREISLPSEILSAFVNFATLNFHSVLIFALNAHPRNLDARIISLIQRLRSNAKILLR